jgi:hypothetical protein
MVPQDVKLTTYEVMDPTAEWPESDEEEETPPEIAELHKLGAEAWNNPGSEADRAMRLKLQEAKLIAPQVRTEAQKWVVRNWKPRSLEKEAARERRTRRRMDEIARTTVENQRIRESQPGPSLVETFTPYRGEAGRGRGMGRGRGRGEPIRAPPTGRMPQPSPMDPVEVQMAYYQQHPQGLPQWILGRYAAVPKTERLTAEEMGALNAYLFLRRVAPNTSENRQPFMRGAEIILSKLGTYEEWVTLLTTHNVPNAEGEREEKWVDKPTEKLDEPKIWAHLARQGITRGRFDALRTWAIWSKAIRYIPVSEGASTSQVQSQGTGTPSQTMDEDP